MWAQLLTMWGRCRIKALKYRCVVRPPFLGGEGPIGTGGELRVGIMGPLEPGLGRDRTEDGMS